MGIKSKESIFRLSFFTNWRNDQHRKTTRKSAKCPYGIHSSFQVGLDSFNCYYKSCVFDWNSYYCKMYEAKG